MSWFSRLRNPDKLVTSGVPPGDHREAAPSPLTEPPPAPPCLTGLAADQATAALTEYYAALRRHGAAVATARRELAIKMGFTHYRWIAAGAKICDVAGRLDGTVLSYRDPPPDGHPREGRCNAEAWCRCAARSIATNFAG